MNLEISLKRVIQLMSRFVTEIKGEASIGRTDLNKAAETILIPILNEIYGWNLENVNYVEDNNNHPGIDLVDKAARICIQVTATTSAEKVKHTLDQFIKHEQYLEYDRLIFFFLQEKKGSYPEKTIQKIVQEKLTFDIQRDLWDYRNLLKEISNFQIERVNRVREILEANFSENKHLLSTSGHEISFQDRITRFKKLQRKARASCIERFRIAVASRETAIALAEDQSLGNPPDSLTLKSGSVHVLTGELGLGKTLIAQRLFQLTLAEAIDNPKAPIPIYIESGQLQKGDFLEEIVETEASGLGDFEVQGVSIFLDGLDEVDSRLASQLLSEAYVLADTLPKTSVLITSRPIPCVNELVKGANIPVPPLSERQAYELIERLSGQKVIAMTVSGWTESVKDAIRRPLFTLILANYLQQNTAQALRSEGELLSWLVRDALRRAKVNFYDYMPLLQQLAVLATESSNGWVRAADLASIENVWEPLLKVGLVVTRSRDVISFPLPILTEWFAAQSLADDPSIIGDCVHSPERLEKWRYPLVIAVATLSHDLASQLLEPIAETYPTFAVEIVMASSSRWGTRETPLPSAQQCGRQLQQAMQAWVNGFGKLSKIISPARKDGSLPCVGTRITTGTQNYLQAAWYKGSENLGDTVDLPMHWDSSHSQEWNNWTYGKMSRPSHESAWAWRWTLDSLSNHLGCKLEFPSLEIDSEPFIREAAWRATLAIARREKTLSHARQNWWGLEKVPLTNLDEALAYIEDQSTHHNCWITLSDFGTRKRQQTLYLKYLRQEINRLRRENQTYLFSPWIGPDLAQGKRLWELYSPQRLQERIQMGYQAALDIYQQIVETWFLELKPGFQIAATLPARLVGYLSPLPGDNGWDTEEPPQFHWFLEALPKEKANTVEINAQEGPFRDVQRERIDRVQKRIGILRPESAVWIRYPPMGGGLSEEYFFGHSSATSLAYSWLRQDLKKVFGNSSFIRSTRF
ncbi:MULTISPECIES: SMEK domain-containing protein [Cyanophyceae]|uniref:ATP-binding protein n=2 Tax=Cyanophyceae TaxID=3028117 RepID=A0A4Q7EAF1_9CYAN|nr:MULTISPECIES: SMEK domain-containing protein [Cyanophyceae]MCM1981980.1 SMEK domain-containing protein [Lyngbya confervoides BDU141951]RZM79503.1 ATP-binding protein [Leptolyngbya sp. LK]